MVKIVCQIITGSYFISRLQHSYLFWRFRSRIEMKLNAYDRLHICSFASFTQAYDSLRTLYLSD